MTVPAGVPESQGTESLFAVEGLPPDLVDAIRKYGHLIPQSQTFNLVLGATTAPATTASAMTSDQWMQAWVSEWQRANRSEVAVEELRDALQSIIACGDIAAVRIARAALDAS